MHRACHLYSILCLLRLQLEDPSPFTEAAPECRAGYDVTREILELRPHIYLLHTIRPDSVLPSAYQLTGTGSESRQHPLQKNQTIRRFNNRARRHNYRVFVFKQV